MLPIPKWPFCVKHKGNAQLSSLSHNDTGAICVERPAETDGPFEHVDGLTTPLSTMPTSAGHWAYIKLSLWKFTSGVWVGGKQYPPTPYSPRPYNSISHFIICSPAPGCSSASWPLWIHLLLLFSTDNWLEQWNACVPCAFETLHPVYFPEVSFLLSFLSLSAVSFLPRALIPSLSVTFLLLYHGGFCCLQFTLPKQLLDFSSFYLVVGSTE